MTDSTRFDCLHLEGKSKDFAVVNVAPDPTPFFPGGLLSLHRGRRGWLPRNKSVGKKVGGAGKEKKGEGEEEE